MREKVLKLIYFDSGNYISYSFLKRFYWYIFIIPFFTMIMGVHSLNQNGITFNSLFPIALILLWSITYWAMIWTIKSSFVKKVFAFRFLINGIVGIFISTLMWIFFSSWNLTADVPFLEFSFFLWMIPAYLLVSVIYVLHIVVGIHNGKYAKRIKKKQKNNAISISLTISSMAFLGILVSRFLQNEASLGIQHIIMTICSIILIFIPSLSHVNLVKYYYCKKYNILCDESGDNESGDLCPKKKEKKRSSIKILLLIIAFVILAFITVNFIKGFIQGIA